MEIDPALSDAVPAVSTAASRVARALLTAGPRTAPDLAETLGLTVQAVRRHLDHLVAAGFVDSHESRPFGPSPRRGRGRPPRVYAITDAGRRRMDQSYDDLALAALRFIEHAGGDPLVREFAAARATGFVNRHAERVRSAADPVAELGEVLTEEGYAAEVVDDTAGLPGVQICQHHCPVADAAARFPQLCDAETGALAQVLGRPVTRLATIAHGDGVCTTHVSPADTSALRSTVPQHSRKATA